MLKSPAEWEQTFLTYWKENTKRYDAMWSKALALIRIYREMGGEKNALELYRQFRRRKSCE